MTRAVHVHMLLAEGSMPPEECYWHRAFFLLRCICKSS